MLTDDYDPLIIEAVRCQPLDAGHVTAIREALRGLFEALSAVETSDMRDRVELALSIPDLRAAMLDQLAQAIRRITDVVAERTGRKPDDFGAATLAGAILGVMIVAEFHWVAHPETDLIALLDDALEHLESDFALGRSVRGATKETAPVVATRIKVSTHAEGPFCTR